MKKEYEIEIETLKRRMDALNHRFGDDIASKETLIELLENNNQVNKKTTYMMGGMLIVTVFNIIVTYFKG